MQHLNQQSRAFLMEIIEDLVLDGLAQRLVQPEPIDRTVSLTEMVLFC